MNTNHKVENFFLPASVLATVDMKEVDATFEAMVECGVSRTPFTQFCITVPENKIIRIVKDEADLPDDRQLDPAHLLEFYFSGMTEALSFDGRESEAGRMRIYSWHGRRSLDYIEALVKSHAAGDTTAEVRDHMISGLQNAGACLVKVLLVLLATKNATKVREKNKLGALGIGKHRQGAGFSYTTTISYGHAPLETEITGTGRTVRPHLRRGHVRHQHFGPGREFVKKVFIEPVFVNSDKDFVSFRDRYNVSLTVPQVPQTSATKEPQP